jgi:hypothetical protein
LECEKKRSMLGNLFTAGRTADRTVGRTVEVAVHDPSVCAGSTRNAESRMNLRTMYPTDQEYQQTT